MKRRRNNLLVELQGILVAYGEDTVSTKCIVAYEIPFGDGLFDNVILRGHADFLGHLHEILIPLVDTNSSSNAVEVGRKLLRTRNSSKAISILEQVTHVLVENEMLELVQ